MTENSSRFVGSIPENYDKGLGPILFEDYAEDLTRRAVAHKATKVIELAAGTGIVSRKLRNQLPLDTKLVVTDLNPPMLDVARAKFKNGENVEFYPADAMSLPFEDESCDLVVCQFGVMFFPDKPAAYREVRRVLGPNGLFLFNAWGTMDTCSFAKIIYDVGANFFPDNPPTFYQVPFGYADLDTVYSDLATAGFQNYQHETVDIVKEVPDWGAFGKGAVFGNPLVDEINQHGTVSPEEVMDAIVAALANHFGAAPASIPLQATIYSASK